MSQFSMEPTQSTEHFIEFDLATNAGRKGIMAKDIDTLHDAPEGRNLFFEADNFQPVKRRIDFVLAYKWDDSESNRDARANFERHLKIEGLQLERDERPELEHHFLKIHAPFPVLDRYADIMKIRLPMKELPDSEVLTMRTCGDQFKVICKAFTRPFQQDPQIMPPLARKFTSVYSRDKKYLFASSKGGQMSFGNATRSRIVDYILRRKKFSDDPDDTSSFGIRKLISDNVYTAAYPLHEGSWKKRGAPNSRKLLFENWAKWGKFYKVQPLDYIRNYFGEMISLYFAWLGFYTMMLVPASIVGLIVFIYGCATVMGDNVANEICAADDVMMCPLCDVRCDYWKLSESCLHARASHLFDNGATFFFAIFMSIWGTIFLELWKRNQAEIQVRWSLTNFEAEEEPARPEFLANLGASNFGKKKNLITGSVEPHLPFWRRRVPLFLMSFSSMILLVLLAVAFVIGVIAYRVSILAILYATDIAFIYGHASTFTSATAAILNLGFIMILNVVYGKLAIVLTNMEHLRTQSEYDDSLTLKLYLLQFVNYYSSLFYIAFFKGRFTGNPGKYNRLFGARQEECMPGGCLIELCLQLAIIMIGKQAMQLLKETLLPKIQKWFKHWRAKETKEAKKKRKPWEKDNLLVDLEPQEIYQEYMEMLIQFGFLTIFVAAFPLAPLFALINNILEIRVDAQKFVRIFRRPVVVKKQDIGMWSEVLFAVSRVAIVGNALIIGFTSDFIPRLVDSTSGEPKGFVNHSLSYFDTADFANGTAPLDSHFNASVCRYKAYRHPPSAGELRYTHTEEYWHVVAARVLFVAAFENFVVILTSIIAWLIPDVPQKLKLLIRRENYITNEIILKAELERFHGTDVDQDSKRYPIPDQDIRRIQQDFLLEQDAPPSTGLADTRL